MSDLPNAVVVSPYKCSHRFHEKCVDSYIDFKRAENSCPLCRACAEHDFVAVDGFVDDEAANTLPGTGTAYQRPTPLTQISVLVVVTFGGALSGLGLLYLFHAIDKYVIT